MSTEYTTIEDQDRAHEAVSRLRECLAELGLPDDQVRQILPITDINRRAYVRLGTVTVDTAEKLIAALTISVLASAEAAR